MCMWMCMCAWAGYALRLLALLLPDALHPLLANVQVGDARQAALHCVIHRQCSTVASPQERREVREEHSRQPAALVHCTAHRHGHETTIVTTRQQQRHVRRQRGAEGTHRHAWRREARRSITEQTACDAFPQLAQRATQHRRHGVA
jgi:hypothetical protein